ncbi:Potassium transporter [Penicillium capsulatum]|uniref:Potassium transporter n=1 Tax=Penicillium capsulatum TaxID=69766 RepID=A0A9W9HZV6_9EURO|nr:Potassium transporter [Penicillium capsulatum]
MKIHAMLIPFKWRVPVCRAIMAILPPFNFLTLHYVYFIATCLVSSIIFYLTSTPWRSVAYVDAVFMCVSAMTGAGLNTVDLSTLNTFQQAILFILLILGSAILISSTVLLVRKRAFEAKFKGVSDEREASRRASALKLQSPSRDLPRGKEPGEESGPLRQKTTVQVQETPASSSIQNDPRWLDDDQVTVADSQSRHHQHRVFPMAGVGARMDLNNHPRDAPLPLYPEEPSGFGFKGIIRGTQKYFSSEGRITRNSQFYGLTTAERDELGGVEYEAISFLSVVVSLYFVMFLLLGIIGVGGWLEANHPEVTRSNGLSPFWTGAFFAVSAFVNSGMSLLDANMTALQLK